MRSDEIEYRVPDDCLCGWLEVWSGEYSSPARISGPVTVLDIGANIGAFSLWARYKWPESTIYAYEPHPALFPILEHNTGWLPRMQRFNCAIGDAKLTTLYECPGSRTCGSQYPYDNKTVEIPIAAVDPVMLPVADLVKIDAEGAELYIIERLPFTPSVLAVEWHSAELRFDIEAWILGRGLSLVKCIPHRTDLGVSIYAKEVA